MTCQLPSSLGDCVPVNAGLRPSDPSFCIASPRTTCGLDGTCDGLGVCRKYVKGTECMPGACRGDAIENVQACDGNGNCTETIKVSCAPFACDSSTNGCFESCTTDAHCTKGKPCIHGMCSGRQITHCTSHNQCLSGYCVDGVCCNYFRCSDLRWARCLPAIPNHGLQSLPLQTRCLQYYLLCQR